MHEVIVAVDPAKRSHTLEVLDHGERVLATLRIENTTAGYRELRTFVKKWPSRQWAVEGAQGVGRQTSPAEYPGGSTACGPKGDDQ
jgi:transposase